MPSRRDFFRLSLNASLATVAYSVLPESRLKVGETAYAAVKTYSDIESVAAVGMVTPVLAKDLMAGKDFTGGIDEGDHTHVFEVSAKQIQELNAGKVVKVKSGKGSDGSLGHTVTIDPKTLVSGGETLQFFESENGELIGLRFGKGDKPFLYVEGVEDLDAASVKYCVKSAVSCQKESSFLRMLPLDSVPDRTIYTSIERLELGDAQEVFVWATTKSKKKVKLAVRVGS